MYLCNHEENVLMLKKPQRENDPNSGNYTIPGGNLDPKEKGSNPKGRLECAVRETKEETGIEVLDPVFAGTILFDNSEREFSDLKNPDDFLVYMFAGTKYEGELKETNEGKPLWVPKGDLIFYTDNMGDRKMYSWLKTGKNFMGVVKFKGQVFDEEKSFVDYFN